MLASGQGSGGALTRDEGGANPSGSTGVIGRYRWLVCALLFFATTVNYMDRQILSLLKPMLDTELKWTNAQFGAVNAAFQAAYAIGLLSFGALIDRVGTKIGYAVSIAAWSLAAMSHALVGSVNGFFVARFALGLGEGGNFPSAIKAVAIWFPPRERAYATALFNSGSNVGAIIAPAVVPWLASSFGWRSAFVAAGIAGLVWLAFWIPWYDVPERIAKLSAAELAHIRSQDGDSAAARAGAEARISWAEILRHRQAWAFIVAKFLTDPVWWFFLIWLPDYFKKTRGLAIKDSWVYLVTIYSIVTVLSIFGGWLSGFLTARGMSVTRARKIALFTFACTVLPILAVTHVGNWAAVVLIGIAGASHQAWSANLFTSASDMFPKRAVASVVGLGSMAGSLGGILFPIFSGKLLDRFAATGNVTSGYAILFGICGSAYLLAFALNHLLAPSFEPIQTPA
ncbi:MAG TPA: MFS transporter [Polyangia bacterium]|jgi:ACS family hexuronate transporter-like MFS transporter|nr:MFS transporter [Polyangia bacterium]